MVARICSRAEAKRISHLQTAFPTKRLTQQLRGSGLGACLGPNKLEKIIHIRQIHTLKGGIPFVQVSIVVKTLNLRLDFPLEASQTLEKVLP